MIASTSIAEWHPVLWLGIFCGPLLGLVLLFSCIPKRRIEPSEIRVGNPLLRGDALPRLSSAQLAPLAHLCRTLGNAELRPLIIGMRHLPVADAAPILQRQLKSSDPELQLHAQCVLQEGQSKLQDRFQSLAQQASHGSPAILASFIECGLAMLNSPLTPPSEHLSIVARMNEQLSPVLAELEHPRALYAAAKYSLHLKQPAIAQTLQARLPAGSPLHADLAAEIAHVTAILNPPPAVSARYQIS
jgi:hypothetical protein